MPDSSKDFDNEIKNPNWAKRVNEDRHTEDMRLEMLEKLDAFWIALKEASDEP